MIDKVLIGIALLLVVAGAATILLPRTCKYHIDSVYSSGDTVFVNWEIDDNQNLLCNSQKQTEFFREEITRIYEALKD